MNRLNTLKNPTQRWEWIKGELRIRGITLASIARDLQVTRNALNNVKRDPYPRMEREIARRLKMQPHSLWPDRWNSDGTPKRRCLNRAESRNSNAVNSSPERYQAHLPATAGCEA